MPEGWVLPLKFPPSIVRAVADEDVLFRAFNCAFEILIWQNVLTPRHGWPACPDLHWWVCIMARSRAFGLPGSLENAAAAIGLQEGKDVEGARLMRVMSRPRRTHDGQFVWWDDEEEKMQRLERYCERDDLTEMQIGEIIPELSAAEQQLWELDQRINNRGDSSRPTLDHQSDLGCAACTGASQFTIAGAHREQCSWNQLHQGHA